MLSLCVKARLSETVAILKDAHGGFIIFFFQLYYDGKIFFALNFQTLSEDERVHGQLLRHRGLVVRGLPCGEPRSRVQDSIFQRMLMREDLLIYLFLFFFSSTLRH